jgi:lipopolysaccharide biosynthesis regulator YciM
LHRLLDHAVGSHDQMLVEAGNNGHGRNFAKMQLQGDYVTSGTLVDVTVKARQGDNLLVERC